MVRVVGIDHLVIRVSDYEKSKEFYGKLFSFLGFEISDEYEDMIGWTNGKTRFWIGRTDEQGRQHKYRFGDVGFHHYAFELRSRKDVDELQRLPARRTARRDRRSGGGILRRLLRGVLPRPRRSQAGRHEIRREPREGGAGQEPQESGLIASWSWGEDPGGCGYASKQVVLTELEELHEVSQRKQDF